MVNRSVLNSPCIFLLGKTFTDRSSVKKSIAGFAKRINTATCRSRYNSFWPPSILVTIYSQLATAGKNRPFNLQILAEGHHRDFSEKSLSQQHFSLVKRSVERMAATGMSSPDHAALSQSFDFFLVLDFEATCDDERPPKPQEIIEFPVLKLNAKTHAIDSIFHHYVRPLYNPHLTPFCTELTGIVQEMVDNQLCFPEVLKSFEQWMESEGLLTSEIKSIFVTCGDWDLKSMLPRQCETSSLASKSYFNKWINIKKSYADVTRTFPKGMMHMLTGLNLQHIGRHHSGIDDCRNIANIAVALMKQGYVFKENGRLK